MKKILLFIIMFFPIVLYASSYNFNDIKSYSGSYISSFSYKDQYIQNTNLYGINEKGLYYENGFNKSGLINFIEYEVIGGKKSYLFDGLNYFTMTYNSSKSQVYEIDISAKGYSYTNLNNLSGIRFTNYIKPKVEVRGIGTYADPWVFIK